MITIKSYLEQTQSLLDKGEYTDGCSMSQFMEKVLSKAKLLCAAHDFGNLSLIDGVRPGLMNQFYSLAAHFMNTNPAYWLWGLIVFTFTLPWIVWRRELGIEIVPPMLFFGLQAIAIGAGIIYWI